MKNLLAIYYTLIIVVRYQYVHFQLLYKQQKRKSEETLGLGNDRTGATFLGDALSDQIYLNDATLWSREQVDLEIFPLIRKAMAFENNELAEWLDQNYQKRIIKLQL